MMIKIAILDDDPIALKITKDLVLKSSLKQGLDISMYKSGEAFLNQANRFDLLLLDIDMPGLNGLEIVERLKGSLPIVIYVTSHIEYMENAFNLNVFRYLHKKELQIKLPIALSAAIERIEKRQDIFWKTLDGIRGFMFHDIYYFEVTDRKCICVARSGRIELVNQKLIDVLSSLNDWFVQINRSQIVNIKYIDSIEHSYLRLRDINHKLPISRKRYKDIMREYTVRMLNDD